MGKHGPQAPDFTIDAMNMAHNQPPSGAGTPWLDNPSQGVITVSGADYASPAARVTAGLPLAASMGPGRPRGRGAVPGCQGTSHDATNVSPRTGTGLDDKLDEVN